MSSKRALYKPTETTKEKRKTLAQGRLVTKTTTSQSHPGRASGSKALAQGVSPEEKNADVVVPSLGQSARQNLSAVMKTGVSMTLGEISPRHLTPHISQLESPRKNEPSDSLDLSDSESDILHQHPAGLGDSQHGVLVVDALQDRRGPDGSEIDIRMEFKPSPHKVICHAASRRASGLCLSGDVSEASKVHVDQVQRVSFLTDTDDFSGRKNILDDADHSPTQAGTPHRHIHAKEGARDEAGHVKSSPKAKHAKEDVVKKLFATGDGSGTLEKSASELSLDRIDSSVSDISHKSDTPATTKTKKQAPPKTKSATLSTSHVKKKKATRVVASRYMSSTVAEPRKGPMKATDRSIISKSSAHSQFLKVAAGTTSRKGSTPTAKKSSDTSKTLSFSTTPEVKGQGGKVSTPTCDDSLFVAPSGVDLSVIMAQPTGPRKDFGESSYDSSGLYAAPNVSKHHSTSQSNHCQRDRDHLGGSSETKGGVKKKVQPRVTQKQLDIQYCRLMQWTFLEAKAKKAFEEQEKKAMAQIHALLQKNEKLRQRDHELDLELARLRHLKMLDSTLETQTTGLSSVASGLPNFKKQYSVMAQALDTTRHQIPAKGIMVPTDQEAYARELLAALSESEQLLGEIQALTIGESQTTNSFVQTIQLMEKSLEGELDELTKVKEQMAAVQTLTTKESALQIQAMQECE